MHAEDLAVLRVGNNLDEAFMRANDGRARICSKWKLADFHVVTEFAGFGFGQADAANFRMAISDVRNPERIDRTGFFAGDLRNRDDALHRSNMRQLRRAEDDV